VGSCTLNSLQNVKLRDQEDGNIYVDIILTFDVTGVIIIIIIIIIIIVVMGARGSVVD
jgi:hypothetical protein